VNGLDWENDIYASGQDGSFKKASQDYKTVLDRVESRFFPPQVALYLVRIACELPDSEGRSLSQWDCTELARQVVAAGLVGRISASTIRRILNHHHLKP
jgi:hypothetical protein